MSEASGGATAMDTLERKFAIPEKSGDAAEADSPEQSGVQTPKHEYQSGFKRLRPKGWEEVEGSEHGTGSGEDDELPGTSAGSIEATPDEVRYLQNRTKSACSQLADIIVELRRERCALAPARPTLGFFKRPVRNPGVRLGLFSRSGSRASPPRVRPLD